MWQKHGQKGSYNSPLSVSFISDQSIAYITLYFLVAGEYYNGEGVLALPKLNLQFLTLHDYLLRNFKLFQLESTYEIRGDIEDAVTR